MTSGTFALVPVMALPSPLAAGPPHEYLAALSLQGLDRFVDSLVREIAEAVVRDFEIGHRPQALETLVERCLPRLVMDERLLAVAQPFQLVVADAPTGPLTLVGELDRLGEDRLTGQLILHTWRTQPLECLGPEATCHHLRTGAALVWLQSQYPDREVLAAEHDLPHGCTLLATWLPQELTLLAAWLQQHAWQGGLFESDLTLLPVPAPATFPER